MLSCSLHSRDATRYLYIDICVIASLLPRINHKYLQVGLVLVGLVSGIHGLWGGGFGGTVKHKQMTFKNLSSEIAVPIKKISHLHLSSLNLFELSSIVQNPSHDSTDRLRSSFP